MREATDPERDCWYEVDDTTVDFSVAALEEYRRATKDIDPGALLKVVDTYEGDDDRPEGARRLEPPSREASLEDTVPGLGVGVESLEA